MHVDEATAKSRRSSTLGRDTSTSGRQGGAGNTAGFGFSRVAREPRLADKVASRILEVIVESPLGAGDALPSERDLGEQFGVSRTVIREALRTLAGKGVVEMGQGRGLRVARVEPSAVHESIGLFLRGRPALDYSRVHEVRALLETEVAGLAAQRATPADIKALAESCEELAGVLDDAKAAVEADLAFHSRLARSTHNELFTVLLDAIVGQLIEIRVDTFQTVEHRAEIALAAHRAIYKQVAGKAAEGARAAMREHLDDVLVTWLKLTSQLQAPDPETPSDGHGPTLDGPVGASLGTGEDIARGSGQLPGRGKEGIDGRVVLPRR
jgi:GntR family transcriptional regulator, transcriptional repressor for pyruvate dehydrogenase complex